MASRTPELEELLDMAIESHLADLHTCMPGKVVEYSKETQKADIKPLLKRRIVHENGEELLESLPVLPDVPISFMRSAGFFLSFPIEPGDLVTIHFAERSLDNYLSGRGEDTDPDEFRMHDLADAIAVPGFYPFRNPIKDISSVNAVFGMDDGGMQIHITPDGVMEVKFDSKSEEAVALGNALQAFWDSAFKPVFDGHIHGDPASGFTTGPLSAPGVPATAPAFDVSIISKYLKVKGP